MPLLPKLPGSDFDDEPFKIETKKPKLPQGLGKGGNSAAPKPKRRKFVFSIGKKVYKPSDFANKPKPVLPPVVEDHDKIYLETLSKLGGGKGMQPTSYDSDETHGYDNYPKNLAYTAEEEVEYKTDYPLTKKQEVELGSSGDQGAGAVSDGDEY